MTATQRYAVGQSTRAGTAAGTPCRAIRRNAQTAPDRQTPVNRPLRHRHLAFILTQYQLVATCSSSKKMVRCAPGPGIPPANSAPGPSGSGPKISAPPRAVPIHKGLNSCGISPIYAAIENSVRQGVSTCKAVWLSGLSLPSSLSGSSPGMPACLAAPRPRHRHRPPRPRPPLRRPPPAADTGLTFRAAGQRSC